MIEYRVVRIKRLATCGPLAVQIIVHPYINDKEFNFNIPINFNVSERLMNSFILHEDTMNHWLEFHKYVCTIKYHKAIFTFFFALMRLPVIWD